MKQKSTYTLNNNIIIMFALHGPIYEDTDGLLIYGLTYLGDKVLLNLQFLYMYLCDLNFNTKELAYSTTYIYTGCPLVLHREDVEVYVAGASALPPICETPDNEFSSDLHKYTLYGNIEKICPNISGYDSVLDLIYYDAKTKKILIGCKGIDYCANKIFLFDPMTKEYAGWSVSEPNVYAALPVFYNDSTMYVIVFSPIVTRIYSFSVNDFFDLFGTGNLVEHGELVYESSSLSPLPFDIITTSPFGANILLDNHIRRRIDKLNILDFTVEETQMVYCHRTIGKYVIGDFIYAHPDISKIIIFDLENVSQAYEVNALQDCEFIEYNYKYVDYPMTILYERFHQHAAVYYLTYKGKAPVIQYDNTDRKIRIIDLITKEPIRGEMWVYESRFAYPIISLPLGIQPYVMTVNDWTSIPPRPNDKCLTFVIKDIE